MALLADDHLGLMAQAIHVLLPLQVLFGALARLGAAQVVAFPIDEHDHVGVLFDRAGFAQVRQLGPLVLSRLDLIVVDYLQLITTGESNSQKNRVQEVSEITGALKALAKELSVPILALSQLSRQVEQREDKRPQLSDLRESGSIEQDADCVMFVYRESYYLGRAEPREGTEEHLKWQEDMDRLKHQAEVVIGKQRHGPIGIVKLSFDADTTKFGNLANDGRYPQSYE